MKGENTQKMSSVLAAQQTKKPRRRHAFKLFELHRWLSDIHVKLLDFESVLQSSGYDEEETLSTLTEQDCEMMGT